MSLEELRDTIDRLDNEIVRLLDERARNGREAAKLKQALHLPLHDPAREREIANRLGSLSDGSMPLNSLVNIYRLIMAETLSIETQDVGPSCNGLDHKGKIDSRAEILENTAIAPGVFRMRLRAPELARAFEPGQFFQLRLNPGIGQTFLRRPFAPSENTRDGLAFVYNVVGEGTRLMSRIPAGTLLHIMAPLGNSYTLADAGASALLIGGGCGAPSLAPLAKRLREAGVKVTVILGARTAMAVLEYSLFSSIADRVIVATDDGSHGCKGTVVDAYRLEGRTDTPPARIYACGPRPMLRAAAQLAEETGTPCEVSLEERMACGFGACVGCAVAVKDARASDGVVYRRVCHDGPVFDSKVLAW